MTKETHYNEDILDFSLDSMTNEKVLWELLSPTSRKPNQLGTS